MQTLPQGRALSKGWGPLCRRFFLLSSACGGAPRRLEVDAAQEQAGQEGTEELRRWAQSAGFDEQPRVELDSEALNFRAASEFFAPVRRWTPRDLLRGAQYQGHLRGAPMCKGRPRGAFRGEEGRA
jgi:hypothetical protein